MRRDQLEHAIRAACQIIGHPEVIVVGSQAILGSYREDELPLEATMSVEVDVLPIADSNTGTAELADLIEGVAGEWSLFEEQHGFSIDGVDLETAILPAGWRDPLVRVQNANTAAPSGQPQFIGWCLDPEDLCVAKLCAHREKDLNFLRALHDAGLVDATVIADRLIQMEARHQEAAAVARRWLASLRASAALRRAEQRDPQPSRTTFPAGCTYAAALMVRPNPPRARPSPDFNRLCAGKGTLTGVATSGFHVWITLRLGPAIKIWNQDPD